MNYSREIVLLDMLLSLKPTAMLKDTLLDFNDRGDIALPCRRWAHYDMLRLGP
jgi:hypothetical protein